MDKQDFIKKVLDYFPNIDINNFIQKIDVWVKELRKWNQKYNLTRLDNENLIYSDYFLNSLIPFYKIDLSGSKKILDIGSGSGIPGILLKIVFPNLLLTIVESNLKKCNFMKFLCQSLKINDVEIVNQRCEVYAHSVIEKFDFVTCRAVAELKIILELGIPMLKIGGIAIFLKSLDYQQEILRAKKISEDLKLEKPNIEIISDKKTLVTLCYEKKIKSDIKFPRKWKEIIS